jgi:hypothetical protein
LTQLGDTLHGAAASSGVEPPPSGTGDDATVAELERWLSAVETLKRQRGAGPHDA